MMGRFQPFHLGHMHLARRILGECDEAIIAVTSSQFNYLEKDPFTAGERIEMIHESIRDSDLDLSRCLILSIENQFNVATWHSYLKAALPSFGRVYSGNDYVSMLLSDSGVEVVVPEFLDAATYNGTRIRSMIASGESLDGLVPEAVRTILERIDAQNRLAVISKSDTIPTRH